MKQNIKISIVCPLYNKSSYIEEMIDSILNQHYTNWELVIVDDGSTDNSYQLVQKFLTDERIALYQRASFSDKKGASVSRNIGIKHATGSYVLFLDADDLLTPECLSKRVVGVRKFPQRGFYLFDTIGFKGDKSQLVQKKPFIEENILGTFVNKKEHFLKSFCKYNLLWNISSVVWDIKTLHRLNGFVERFQRLQDPELHIRALMLDDINFKSFLNDTEYTYTVLIRLDEGRRSADYLQHFQNHVNAVVCFLDFFKAYLEKNKKSKYARCFEGYVLSVEQIHIFSQQNSLVNYKSVLDDFYDNSAVKPYINRRLTLFIKLLRFTGKIKILRKFKCYSMLIRLYKISL